MTDTDTNPKNYEVTLQDINGITISGTNYKINGGRKVSLEADSVVIEFPMRVATRPRSNRELVSTTQYTSLLGQHTYAGIDPIKITIKGKMWADESSQPRDCDFKPMTLQMLNDIRVYNHKLFIQDYHGTSTSIVTPIFSMCGKQDLLGNVPYTTSGIPVAVTEINGVNRGTDSERGLFMTYNLTLEEDR